MPENNYWLQTKDERNNPFIQFGEFLKQIGIQSKPNLDNVPQMPKNRYGRTYFGHPTFNPFTRGPRFVEDGGNI